MTTSPGGERRGQALRDPGCEHLAADRPVQDEGRHDPVAQPDEEDERLPVAVRHLCHKLLALGGPAAGLGHVGPDPVRLLSRTGGAHRLTLDEDQAPVIEPVLLRLPARAEPRHVRAHLLCRHQGLF